MSISAWEPDPTGRHQYRWFDGEQWTDQVADDGVQAIDTITASEASLPHDVLTSVPPPAEVGTDFSGPPPGWYSHNPLSMLSSKGKRFGAWVLEVLLIAITLGIGWLVWALIVFSRGQTPAKQVLDMRVVRLNDQQAASWWWMALRELVLKGVLGLAFTVVLLIGPVWVLINGIVLLANVRNQALWDMMMKTVVVNDSVGLFRSVSRPRGRSR